MLEVLVRGRRKAERESLLEVPVRGGGKAERRREGGRERRV